MPFHFESTQIPEVILIKPKVFGDERGYFLESYHAKDFAAAGIPYAFVQDNQSLSKKDTLRGLHFQAAPHSQGKLVRVVQGAIWDVAVDIRPNSPHFGKWTAHELSDSNHCQLFIPEGFAHGFLVLSDTALVQYKTSSFYAPDFDRGIAWNDPEIAIPWPVKNPLLSPKDQKQPLLKELKFD
ncbi:MAG TPA: dTDP-4-dehydrorhamnose 3,5-epimerase [Candidatus Marinimicrobia bacterium]|nr:dTDP-4-dehydrorhamnose 3,5-epimerase [Candidatus Neomarinimicrobiota bacterium]